MPNSGSFGVLLGLGLKGFSTLFRAEVKGSAAVRFLDGGILFINLHAADWIGGHKNPPSWRRRDSQH
jgi:hypothetical protein